MACINIHDDDEAGMWRGPRYLVLNRDGTFGNIDCFLRKLKTVTKRCRIEMPTVEKGR